MSKFDKRTVAILAALFVAFSAAAFAIPFHKGGTFWVAYIAEVIAVVMQFFFFKSAFEGSGELKSRVLGFPIARIGFIYLAVQTAVSVVFFILGAVFTAFPVGVTVAVCVIILCAAFIFGIVTDTAREVVQQVESDIKKETPVMRQLIAESKALVSLTEDSALKTELADLAEKFRFSDPVSSPELQAIEDELLQQLTELRNMLNAGDTRTAEQIKIIEKSLDERNIMCKSYK